MTKIFEWVGHLAGSKRAGGSEQTILEIQLNRDLEDVPAKEALIIRFGRALFREHKVSPELYVEVVKTFGQRGMVEASWIMGDYAMAAVALRGGSAESGRLAAADRWLEIVAARGGTLPPIYGAWKN